MLTLHPQSVTFGALRWENIQLIAIDRACDQPLAERSDGGPHITFADCPRQLVTIRILQQPADLDLLPPACADQDTLTFYIAASASQAQRTKVTALAVIQRIKHELSNPRNPARELTLLAISPDGHSDPITITPADAET